jgi:hypothetical protein
MHKRCIRDAAAGGGALILIMSVNGFFPRRCPHLKTREKKENTWIIG